DDLVTGVQTCALPIFAVRPAADRTAILPRPAIRRRSSDFLYFDQAVVEGRAAAEVGSALRSDVVGVAAVARIFFPPHRRRDHHAGTRLAVDARPQRIAAAVVEDAHQIAVADASALRVAAMH